MTKTVIRETDGAVFIILPRTCGGKHYAIFREKNYGEEVTLEPAYFMELGMYGQEVFFNLVQAYQYLKVWIEWLY